MFAQHEHWLPTFAVKLFEQQQRLLLETKTALLIAVYDVEGVLTPIVVDLVPFQRNW